MIIQNDMVKVWAEIIGYDRLVFCNNFGVFRIIYCDGEARIMLTSKVEKDKLFNLVTEVKPRCTIELHINKCGNPSEYHLNNLWLRFEHCICKRRWIPSPAILDLNKAGTITYYVEFKSAFYSIIHNGIVEGKF